ncbi:MAG: family 78 glycoside hydrolase catalytic domain [Proteiniphilum sp.]|nr:family 78 glycoside hydrolase catalytic domain [Proteiniphilum sp.]MEA4915931.1 family 78 glycoside hydrolase catalytic domain [Proteiniphilum sp.]
MRKTALAILLNIILCGNLLSISSPVLVDLRCENLVNPNGIDNSSPHFSWKIQSDTPMVQHYYEIQVASDSLLLINDRADLWNSTKVRSSASVMVPYKGKPLQSRMLCYWRVRVWDEKGNISAWSPVQRFGIGVSENDPLKGEYIGLTTGDARSPILRKSFAMDKSGITLLHVNSLGYHEIYLNGEKVGDDVLSPAVSQLNKRSLVVTYDVTPYLRQGENELILWLGQGWYKKTTFGADHDGPVVKAEMNTLQNRKWKQVVVTDDTWVGRESGYSDTGTWQALQFGGERIDGRLLPGNLSGKGLENIKWVPVKTIRVPDHKVSPQMCEPNKIQEVIIPKSIEPLGNNSWLVDMGKTLTGWFELRIPQLPEGDEIKVVYSDYMTKEGAIEEQGESDIYIASGKPNDLFCNKFNHHAFRYVKITNLPIRPTKNQIKSYLIHGDYQPAATFRCSDNELNAIHDMVNYTLRTLTFSGYMVDCPHIERTGYGGDGNSSTQALQTMYDVSPTYMNWLLAWKDAMREGGSLPHVAPNPGAGGGGPYWCGFIVLAPWRTYVNYGDPRLLDRYYSTMKEWMGYVDKYTVDGLLKRWPDTPYRDWYLGDWLAPEGVDTGNQSSIDLVNNCFISECLSALQKIATLLDKQEEAKAFAQRKTQLNRLIHETFYDPGKNIYATGSQLDMSYPMLVGAVPEELYDKVKEELVARTNQYHNGHLAVGLVGVPILTDWAIQNREVDFMYSMLKKKDYPGYLYMLDNNATTTWEYWKGERSRIHNCYNGIGSWFYQAVGGIRVDEEHPGYQHAFIEPQIPKGVTWAHTTKESPYGTIVVNWELKENRQNMRIILPIGVKATVSLPNGTLRCIVDGKSVDADKQFLTLQEGTYEVQFEF